MHRRSSNAGADDVKAAVEYWIAIAIVAAIVAVGLATQEPIAVNGGRGYDGSNYYEFAEQLRAGERPAGPARFVRRIGTPIVAALSGVDNLISAFRIVNICAVLASTLLLVGWLRRYLDSFALRVAVVCVFATHWLQLVRFTVFYPVLVDAWSQTFCFAGLLCTAAYEEQPSRGKVLAISAISLAGVCFREVVLLVPLAFLLARNTMPRLQQWIPLTLAAAALVAVDALVLPTDAGFTASDHLLTRAASRSPLSYGLGWLVAFGPALCLILFDWRNVAEFFKRHLWMFAYVLGVAAAGWAGSLESERHALNWGSPVVYLLMARAFQNHARAMTRSGALVLLAAAQLLVGRVLWGVPQPAESAVAGEPAMVLTPLGPGTEYLDLFPDYLAPSLAWSQFLQHAAVGAVVIVLIGAAKALAREKPLLVPFAAPATNRGKSAVAALRASATGLRQLGAWRALQVLGAAFLAISLFSGLALLLLLPHQPITIHVRWTPDADAYRRPALEQQLKLGAGRRSEGTTWVYQLDDPSTNDIRAIVTHPDVEDTAHLNRVWFRPEFGVDRERRSAFYGVLTGGIGAVAFLLWMAARRGTPPA